MTQGLWIVLGNGPGTKEIYILNISQSLTATEAIGEVIEMLRKDGRCKNPEKWNYVVLDCNKDPEEIRSQLKEFFKRIGVPERELDYLVQSFVLKTLGALWKFKGQA